MMSIFLLRSWICAAVIVGCLSIASGQANTVAAGMAVCHNNKMFEMNIAQFNRESMGSIGVDKSPHEEALDRGSKEKEDDVQKIFFNQTLDHFGERHSLQMFEQRFFYTDRFVRDTSRHSLRSSTNTMSSDEGPVYAFLCVGGEGPPMDKSVLVDSVHCTGDMIALAEKLRKEEQASVHLYALEHRYYGESTPEGNDSKNKQHDANVVPLDDELDVSNKKNKRCKYFQYLSSRQAQADVASFITLQNAERSNHTSYEYPSVKWVTFGGSYPGMMAGWARYRFPHLIHASVSSSAPVQAQLDFPEFFDAVGMSLEYDVVGGSKECRASIEKGHDDLGNLLSLDQDSDILQKNQKIVADLFQIEGGTYALDDARNLQIFMGQGVISIPVQSNDPSCGEENCNFEKVSTESKEMLSRVPHVWAFLTSHIISSLFTIFV
jgi:serine protease 16